MPPQPWLMQTQSPLICCSWGSMIPCSSNLSQWGGIVVRAKSWRINSGSSLSVTTFLHHNQGTNGKRQQTTKRKTQYSLLWILNLLDHTFAIWHAKELKHIKDFYLDKKVASFGQLNVQYNLLYFLCYMQIKQFCEGKLSMF